MANLTESSVYESGVPQLETTTQARGGPGGVMNAQAQALANRTKFLKDVLDSPTELANRLPDATTSVKGKVQLASTGVQDATKVPKATGAEIASILTAGGYSLAPATGTSNLDNIADGTSYKRVQAAEATALRASGSAPWTVPTLYFKDSYRAQVEAASGGQNTVLYDDQGNPSVMVWVPAFTLGDISTLLGDTSTLHPAFVVNGVAKPGIWIGAYQAKVISGRACSLPGQDPTTLAKFDQAKSYCTAKGAGWHMMTAWEWAAVALWCLKNSFQPRGNTNYGSSHAATYETGARVDGGIPGSSSGTPRIRTGSGPASWRHNNTFMGIADLVGNLAEWNDGYKTVDGRMYFPDDNNYSLSESSWPAQDAYWDGTVSGSAGAPVLSNTTPVNVTTDAYYNEIHGEAGWRSLTYSANYDTIALALRQKLAAMMIAPKVSASGSLIFSGASGAVSIRNNGERFPIRGGGWNYGASAGLASLYQASARSHSYSTIGFRPAYIA